MIHRTRMPSLEQVCELFDDPRYLESKGPDHEAYNAMANRLHRFHLNPERWPKPEPFRLGRPLAPRLPVGAGGINLPNDVADLTDGLLSLGGLGLSGWLPRTATANSQLNAAIVGFQRLNNLKPDGLVKPDGPTINVLNGYLPLPQAPETIARAPMVEAAVLNQGSRPQTPAGRPITARGMGDEALAQSRAEAAMEAERRAEDPFGDIFGGRRYERSHIGDMLDEQEAEARAQPDREAEAGLGQMDYAIGDAGADKFELQLLSMNNSQRDRVIGITMGHEGGLSKDKKTNFGIQQNTLDAYRAMNTDAGFEQDVALLERKEAAQIYREMFYDRYGIGEIDDFSMASHVFDLVVHHGPGKAAQIVQEAINKMVEELAALTGEKLDMLPGYKLRYDRNNIGEETRALLEKIIATQTIHMFHNNLVNERIANMQRIAKNNPEDRDYLNGWIDRAESFRP